ncbi:DNA polymerase Y family protein [Ancylobacter sp. MQZ15Z-1]|uniref:DNA polymerase Y family protein n=1 Tax=Ancylobacter mangrovi TaxID=2972472 RepID=A0A9X2T205_9HYPH|nr:DNA polymerase Y family protein [Ancylobacter mangrovi]MCS0495352.1 DNA polymerase Y family protein [Ancylobacter mangrovi]
MKNALRLAAVDRQARRCGLAPGLTLADARARIPDLAVIEHDPVADAAFLEAIADDCDRWTPLVALDGADGLVLDITGCAHLFGGEAMMRARLLDHLERRGLGATAVIAGTPEAARALARASRGGVVPPGGEARAVAPLPVALLGIDETIASGLSRAGLKTMGDLAERPGTPLAARFGVELLVRLRRTLGHEDVRIVPRRPLPACIAERRFAEPIGRAEDIEGALAGLVGDLALMLEARGEGGRAFEASFFRADGAVRRLKVETARPSRDAPALMRLYRERIAALADPIDPGFGFDLVRLAVLRAEPLTPAQVSLDGRAVAEEEVAELTDRLAVRLGRERVLRFSMRDTHDPERVSVQVPAGEPVPPMARPEFLLPRPLTLFDPPQPVEALAEVPDGPPLRFRWRRVVHEVTRAEGPERIAPEWWRVPGGAPGAPHARELTRDYFRVENREGRRFWLFRAGLYDREPAAPRWFLHGLFA